MGQNEKIPRVSIKFGGKSMLMGRVKFHDSCFVEKALDDVL